MRYIGDVHHKFDEYLKIIEGCERSIQVGDFGAGFDALPVMSLNHGAIRGNHDNPQIIKAYSNWIPDGYYDASTKTFFLGGALSIDKHNRISGRDFWEDEELSMSEMYAFMDFYETVKPEIFVSHDCPQEIFSRLFSSSGDRSRTRQALDCFFDIHKPNLWVFGHHHKDKNITYKGTEFRCLGELSFVDIE